MGELSLTDQETAILIEALSALSLSIAGREDFVSQYKSVDSLLMRVRSMIAVNQVSSDVEVTKVLGSIAAELNSVESCD